MPVDGVSEVRECAGKVQEARQWKEQHEDKKKAIRMAEVLASLPEQKAVEYSEQVLRAHKNFVQVRSQHSYRGS